MVSDTTIKLKICYLIFSVFNNQKNKFCKLLISMDFLSLIFQIIVSVSVLYIWIFRYDNIVLEFKHYGYSDVFRNFVGASKISISVILILGIWYQEFVIYASLSMAFFMFCAQLSHLKVKNPLLKFVPSFVFLLMSLFIASNKYGLI